MSTTVSILNISFGVTCRLSDEFRSYGEGTEWRKRHTVDSGYSTTDSLDKSRWSPSEAELPGNKPVSPGISVFSQPNQTAPWPTSPGQTTSPPANWNPGDQVCCLAS